MRRTVCLLALALACSGQTADYTVYQVFTTGPAKLVLPSEANTPAYLKDRSNKWVEAPSEPGTQPGTIAISIQPTTIDKGKALLVTNKPAWVELNDNAPPDVVAIEVNGKAVEAQPGHIRLDQIGPHSTIAIRVRDAANRIAPARCSALFDGQRKPLAVTRDDADPKTATLAFTVPQDCGFGQHTLVLRADDEAPEASVAERTFTFALFGMEISRDGQEVALHTSACSYHVTGTRGLILAPFIGKREVRVALTGSKGFLHTEKFKSPPKVIVDEPDRKVVTVNPGLYLDKANAPSDDFDFVLELEIRRDFPGLLVTSRATATRPLKRGYQFWSEFKSSDYYIGSDGKRYEWHPSYAHIVPQGWIYLSPPLADSTGYGLITNGRLDEYLGKCALIFTKPHDYRNMKPGDAMVVKFAIVPADGPDEVGRRAKQIADWLGQ